MSAVCNIVDQAQSSQTLNDRDTCIIHVLTVLSLTYKTNSITKFGLRIKDVT